jgi:hypothetical protein
MTPYPASMSPRTRLISIVAAVFLVVCLLVLSFGPSPSNTLAALTGPATAPATAPSGASDASKPSEKNPANNGVRESDDPTRRWLIATPMAAKSVTRRMIVRNTWQRLYRENTPFISRFVVSRVDDIWKPYLRAENDTYGDIIELPHLEENGHIANSIKTVEFFNYLRTTQPDRWDLVTKIDDDSFVDARVFWKTWLQPALAAGKNKETTWGRTLYLRDSDIPYTGGQFYTYTYDLVKRVAELYTKNRIEDFDEDALPSRLMREGGFKHGVNWTQIDLPSAIAFDYNGENQLDEKLDCPWAKPDADLNGWAHSVGPGSLNPHKMKTDVEYLKVASCWDGDGYMKKRPEKQG